MPKTILFDRLGPADVLRIEDVPEQEPQEDEIRLRIEAIGLNRAEVMFRTGTYLEKPSFPSRLGLEAAGVVDAIGQEVTESGLGIASARSLRSR